MVCLGQWLCRAALALVSLLARPNPSLLSTGPCPGVLFVGSASEWVLACASSPGSVHRAAPNIRSIVQLAIRKKLFFNIFSTCFQLYNAPLYHGIFFPHNIQKFEKSQILFGAGLRADGLRLAARERAPFVSTGGRVDDDNDDVRRKVVSMKVIGTLRSVFRARHGPPRQGR